MKIEKKPEYAPAMQEQREEVGLSIRQLAAATGVDRTKIARWERGDGVRMIREAVIVARALGTTVEDLFADDDDWPAFDIRSD